MTLYYSSKVFRSVDPDFINELSKWYLSRRETLKIPIFNHTEFDLARLWHAVQEHGGSEKVCRRKRWAAIGRLFKPPPSMTNLSFHMKRLWSKYLLDYERELYTAGAMLTEDSDLSKLGTRRAADVSDASSMKPRKVQKTGSEEEVEAPVIRSHCRLEQDCVRQDAENTYMGDSTATPQVEKLSPFHKLTVRLGDGSHARFVSGTQPQCEAPQKSQEEVQAYNNVWLVLPSGETQKLALSGQAVELAAAGSLTEQAESPSSMPLVQTPMLWNEQQQTFAAQQHDAAGSLGIRLHSQQQEPMAMETSVGAVATSGNVQVMPVDDWYKQRIEELHAEHAQDMAKLKQTICELQGRISELEGSVSSMGTKAEVAHQCFNALLQLAHPNVEGVMPVLRLLALSLQQQQVADCATVGGTKEPSTPPNNG